MDAPREFVYDRTQIYRPANYGGGYSMREVTLRTGLSNLLTSSPSMLLCKPALPASLTLRLALVCQNLNAIPRLLWALKK
jgi:hypothetical protein